LLRINTELIGERARVVFQDDGPGISEENLKKIFDPFFTTKEIGKGTGLGLSLSYGIIQEHGGTISVKSKFGEGATFTIDLPIAHDTVAAESEVVATRPASDVFEGDGKRVLVVDDEDSILELAREILTAGHFQVETATDGKSALRKLRQNRYDYTVCDLKMPDLSGQQIYELLRSTNPQAASRFIFMTGDMVNERTQEFFERHGRICLAKPFSLEDFRAVFKQVLQPESPAS
jgi:CheY-like chemotaxis protein